MRNLEDIGKKINKYKCYVVNLRQICVKTKLLLSSTLDGEVGTTGNAVGCAISSPTQATDHPVLARGING